MLPPENVVHTNVCVCEQLNDLQPHDLYSVHSHYTHTTVHSVVDGQAYLHSSNYIKDVALIL